MLLTLTQAMLYLKVDLYEIDFYYFLLWCETGNITQQYLQKSKKVKYLFLDQQVLIKLS